MATNGVSANGVSVEPEWLKQELFESILKEIEPNYVRICNFTVRNATTPGENYATIILRIEIEIELKDGRKRPISFVMKVPVQSEQFAALMKLMKTFEIEESMYTNVIPELEKLYSDVGVDIKFSGRSYNLPVPNDIERLLLEDLCPRGFKNANRLVGLDMEHTKRVLQKLAQWHAASAVRVETKGKYNERLMKGNFIEELKPVMQQMTDTFGATLRRCMLSYDGHKDWIHDVDALRVNLAEKAFNLGKIDANDFNVLNHGDCWSNNVMFQYDAFGKIKEVYFVDYQIPKYGSPAHDLYYFLLSSTQYEIKLKHFDYFIKYYHDQLIEHLKLLNYAKPLPKLRHLHIMLHKYGLWAYVTISGVMAAVLMEPTDKAHIDNFTAETADGTALKMVMFSNPRFRKQMEALLPWLQNRGVLET